MRIFFRASLGAFLAVYLLGFFSEAQAGSVSRTAQGSSGLDTVKIHKVYLDGDFEKAIGIIEPYVKAKRLMSHGDSLFAFKHLGVMYAADPGTREKGKYYMYQFIQMEPDAKIQDMYASDAIYTTFQSVHEDYETKQRMLAQNGGRKSKAKYWVAGGAVAAAGAVGLVFFLMDEPKSKTQTIVVKD